MRIDGNKAGTLRGYLVSEIRRAPQHRIPFSSFMEASLYHPDFGYYYKGAVKIGGKDGHFSTHPVSFYPYYSYALADHLSKVFQCLGAPTKFNIIEMGAGNGLMAKGILDYLQRYHPNIYGRTSYQIVEISPELKVLQERNCFQHKIMHMNSIATNFR